MITNLIKLPQIQYSSQIKLHSKFQVSIFRIVPRVNPNRCHLFICYLTDIAFYEMLTYIVRFRNLISHIVINFRTIELSTKPSLLSKFI